MKDTLLAGLFVVAFVVLMIGVFWIMPPPQTPTINYQATPMSRPGRVP